MSFIALIILLSLTYVAYRKWKLDQTAYLKHKNLTIRLDALDAQITSMAYRREDYSTIASERDKIRKERSDVEIEQPNNYYQIAQVIFLLGSGFSILLTLIILSGLFKFIAPGQVGIVVDLFGDSRGVEEKELGVGMHVVAPWKQIYFFPTYEQNHQWIGEDGFTFQTAEGLSVKADIGIVFNLEGGRIHELFCKYRKGMDEITHLFIKNYLRDAINKAASKMNIEDLYGPKKEAFFASVQESVQQEVEPLGFHISHIFIMGKFNVPEVVLEALNKKIEATQRAQQRENELRESEAEAKKKVAAAEGEAQSKLVAAKANAEGILVEARANAEANNLLRQSLTLDVVRYHGINKWDGKLPSTIAGDTASFLIDLKGN